MIFRSGLFTFYSQDLVIIVTPENFDVKEKSALEFSNETMATSCLTDFYKQSIPVRIAL